MDFKEPAAYTYNAGITVSSGDIIVLAAGVFIISFVTLINAFPAKLNPLVRL